MTVIAAPSSRPRQRSPLAAIVRNVTSNWAALVANTLISFLLAPVVVNSLGSVYYGIWSLVMQFTGYLWLFDFGVRESVIKYVAQHHAADEHDAVEATIRTAVTVYAGVSFVTLLAVGAFAAALPYFFNVPQEAVATARIATFLTGATVAQSFLSNVGVGVLMGLQRFYVISQTAIAFSVVRAIATYVLLKAGYGLISLAALNLVVSLASSALVFKLCSIYLPAVPMRPIRPAWEEVRKLFNYGKYVLISNIGDKIVFASDALVIGMFLPIAALTPYAIAGTLIAQMRSIVTSMASIVNPLTSSLSNDPAQTRPAEIVKASGKAAMLVGLPICIGFIVLGERFITLWMGDTYAETAGLALSVLAIGYIVGLPYYTISGVLYGLGAHRVIAMLRLVEGAANLALSVALVRRFGVVGVAIGTTIPHIVVVGRVLPMTLPKLFPIVLRDYYRAVYLRPIAASVPFGTACWIVDAMIRPANLFSFFGWGLLTLVCYVVSCWFVALSAQERVYVGDAIRARVPRGRPAHAA